MVRDAKLKDRFNRFGKLAFDTLHHGYAGEDAFNFVSMGVVAGQDNNRTSLANIAKHDSITHVESVNRNQIRVLSLAK